MSEQNKKEQKRISPVIYALATTLAALAGFLAVYESSAPNSNGGSEVAVKSAPSKPRNISADSGLKAYRNGKMAGFVVRMAPKPLPEFTFKDGEGQVKTVADWKGKIVLLNLWATWCAPCLKEMPALDRLKTELGGENFDVLALSIDRGGPEKPQKFLDKIKVKSLALYNDETSKMGSKLKIIGMPTTLLLDRNGKELGRLTGPAEWDSEDAKALIKAAIKGEE